MDEKKRVFEEYPVLKSLAIMAVPAVVSQLITLVYNIADTWYIGLTGDPNMVAACSLVLPIFMLTNVVANIFGTGGGSLISRLLGAGEQKEAGKVFAVSLWMSVALSLVLAGGSVIFADPFLKLLGASDNTIGFAKQYLIFVVGIGGTFSVLGMVLSNLIRSIGYSKEAGLGMGIGGVLNIILDPIFMFVIFPEGKQVMGAAVATMISNIVAFLYFVFVCVKIRENPVVSINPAKGLPTAKSMASIFGIGIPAGFSVFLFDVSNMFANNRMAAHGDTFLAAYGIITKVERLPLNIGVGICIGMIPLIAYNYSSGNKKRMKAIFNCARIVGLSIAAVCVVLYYVFSAQVVEFFIKDEQTVYWGTVFLRARCFATPFMFLCFNMVNFFTAVGKGRTSFLLPVIRQLVFNIPIMLLLDKFYGAAGLVWTQLTADVCTVIVSYVIFIAFKKKELA